MIAHGSMGELKRWIGRGAIALCFGLIQAPATAEVPAGAVTQERAIAAYSDTGSWMLHGGTFDEQRFSRLSSIRPDNVSRLGLAWYRDIPAEDGLNAAPIAVDGVLYISAPKSLVYAVDIRTGAIKWSYDPHVNLDTTVVGSYASRVNRGVAVWEGKVFVGTGDCRLIALDANAGSLVWEVPACDVKQSYYKNGAPRVAGGLVFTGTGGSEFGARGFIDAYDARNGARVWRFYTVPTQEGPQETEALTRARETWRGAKSIEGGTVWDAMTYDPGLDLLFFGTAGGVPFSHKARSPGGGSNLYWESIIAVRARTGKYVWHFQTTPEDNYDFNANMQLTLADLTIEKVSHKVLMTAPKNGYFYVLDRATGKLLRMSALTKTNWASSIDPVSGRPTWNPAALPENIRPGHCFTLFPGGWGAHNWHAMSFSPIEGLAFIPVNNMGSEICKNQDGSTQKKSVSDGRSPGDLVAWDVLAGKARWRMSRTVPYNGGTMATASGLVFEGTGDGQFQAVNAKNGKMLWSMRVGASILGPPITFALDGQQYVLVLAGESSLMSTFSPEWTSSDDVRGAPARILAFTLGATGELPVFAPHRPLVPEPPPQSATEREIEHGDRLYHDLGCEYCHGNRVDNGRGHSVPNLLYILREIHDQWDAIVIGGALRHQGMLPFPITPQDSQDIHSYVKKMQTEAYESQHR